MYWVIMQKNSVKDEFNHMMIVQKHVNSELAGIMKNLEEATKKENKPIPATQPSGMET